MTCRCCTLILLNVLLIISPLKELGSGLGVGELGSMKGAVALGRVCKLSDLFNQDPSANLPFQLTL